MVSMQGSPLLEDPTLRYKEDSSLSAAGSVRPGTASTADTAAYLESLFAASYLSQPAIDVDHCYEVLEGCPWLLPRPVYVLATGSETHGEVEAGNTYTLRVRMAQKGAASDIAKLLGKAHLAQALEVSQLRDGLVVFDTAEAAENYGTFLEEEGHSQVMVAEVDSHKLFRMVLDARAVVVHMLPDQPLPPPYQLAAALKKSSAWDDK